jgi:hypothetical protein
MGTSLRSVRPTLLNFCKGRYILNGTALPTVIQIHNSAFGADLTNLHFSGNLQKDEQISDLHINKIRTDITEKLWIDFGDKSLGF